MRPDGAQVAYIRSVNTIISPGYIYPYYSPPIYGFVPFLFTRAHLGRQGGDRGARHHQHGLAARSGPAPASGARRRAPAPTGSAPRRRRRPTRCASGWSRATRSRARSPTPPRRRTGATWWRWPSRWSTTPTSPRPSAARSRSSTRRRARSLRDLTTAHADGAPAFSPDGKQVAFTRGEDLYVVAVVGRRQAKLLRHGVRDPTWGAR